MAQRNRCVPRDGDSGGACDRNINIVDGRVEGSPTGGVIGCTKCSHNEALRVGTDRGVDSWLSIGDVDAAGVGESDFSEGDVSIQGDDEPRCAIDRGVSAGLGNVCESAAAWKARRGPIGDVAPVVALIQHQQRPGLRRDQRFIGECGWSHPTRVNLCPHDIRRAGNRCEAGERDGVFAAARSNHLNCDSTAAPFLRKSYPVQSI